MVGRRGDRSLEKRFHFDLTFFKRFLKLSKILFPSCFHVVTLLFAFLLTLSLLEQYVVFNIGLVPSKFYKVLGDKDRSGFISHSVTALLLILAEAFIKSTLTYATNVMYITWRKGLCLYLHSQYFKNVLFYQVNVLEKKVDNPDQRITQDVDKMCSAFSQILTPLIISPFTIGYYLYQAYSSTGYIGPVSVVCFFLVATVINKFLMSPVVNYVYKQERMEGNFRFKHMQMRTHSESVAFYRSGSLEEEKTNHRLENLIQTQHGLIRREYALNFFINICDYVGSILSYIALAVPIFAGRYDDLSPSSLSALISKNAFVCIYLISCFTKLIDMAAVATDVAGTAHRIAELLEHMSYISAESSASYSFLESQEHPNRGRPGPVEVSYCVIRSFHCVFLKLLILLSHSVNFLSFSTEHDFHVVWCVFLLSHQALYLPPHFSSLFSSFTSSRQSLIVNEDGLPHDSNLSDLTGNRMAVSLKDVTFGAPKSKVIFCRGLYMDFKQNTKILITGDSGCGKSSLLRVINGLWPVLSGSVERKVSLGPRGLLILPQVPYFTDGSLREQVIYPLKMTSSESVSGDDSVIQENLAFVGLSSLVDRVGGLDVKVDWNWYDELSPGEMQRLSFVRLFYHKPPFAVLDEATSQISHKAEGDMYRRCSDLGISVLSVGHRESLQRYHDVELHLDQGGTWTSEYLRESATSDVV
ncbi:lysosomal cobalamin transporter ABCD4-like [Liolophura sinensis]|uniref:lysosomal cobalamin transporter ABCD4-like n=1 Tax=Liolophura sinensis TaxID=3198878 RepID=UPI0031588EE4